MSAIDTQFSDGILPDIGIYRNNTDYYSGFKYVDGDKVRFSSQVPEKIGGWQKEIVTGTFLGVPRAVLPWSSLDSTRYRAVGTNLFLYLLSGGVYYNITPFRATSSLTDPITTYNGEARVGIEDTLHSAAVGDYINFPSSVAYNGVTLLGDYIVTEVVDADNYEITAATNASSSGTGGGSVTIKYYLEAGLEDSGVSGYGWGVGPYGMEEYGTARSTGLVKDARMWCLQNWGEDLLALPIGKSLYFWDTSVGTSSPATIVTNAPTQSNFMLVASTFRQVILFGTQNTSGDFDPMIIRCSDEEDYTTWTPAVPGNSAREFRLTRGNKIVGAIESKGGEILVFTDQAAYRMRPTSGDSVYEIELIGENCGLLSPFAAKDVDGIVFWMSPSAFKYYNGQIRTLPVSLEDYIFDQRSEGFYNPQQTVKYYMGINGDFNEIWLFYATRNSTEIDRYVILNYGNNSAYDGTIERTCWADKAFATRPIGYDSDGVSYIHEQGLNDDASPMLSYVKLGDVDISNGAEFSFIDKFMPDGYSEGSMALTLYAKKYPKATAVNKTYSYLPTAEKVSVRMRGRLLSAKWTSNTYNGDFKLGKIKFAIKPDGAR